jgi:solute carrier family 25 (adenine nucleotide translocator) protein 4/5/6/31
MSDSDGNSSSSSSYSGGGSSSCCCSSSSSSSSNSNSNSSGSSCNSNNNSKLIDFTIDLIAGGLSSIIAKTAAAPIERIKILLQTQHINSDIVVRYNGPIDCIKRLYRESGLLSFWRGNVANVARLVPTQALNFAFKDLFRDIFVPQSKSGQQNLLNIVLGSVLSGGLAGGVTLMGTYPLEVVRTRMAADIGLKSMQQPNVITMRYSGTIHCFQTIYNENGGGWKGIKAHYNGFVFTFIGTIVYRGLYLGGYDVSKYFIPKDKNVLMWKMISAQVVSTSVGILIYPVDTIRRRLMMQAESGPKSHANYIYKGAIDCFRMMVSNEGWRSLYYGLGVNIVRSVSSAMLLVCYDLIKEQMDAVK